MVKILRDAGLSELVASDEVERLAQGFQFTEGPLWCPDGTLLFQDTKAERTYGIALDRSVRVLREQTGAANGQTFMPGGAIAFCEQNGRRVSRMLPDGSVVQPLCETWSGQRLNSPNDIVCRTDGRLYFTDPPYGVAPRDRALHFQGVYSLDAGAEGPTASRLLADDLEKPNGLAFSPDESVLYINDSRRGHIRAFDLAPNGTVARHTDRVFADLRGDESGVPDGMKVDIQGNVYCGGSGGLWIMDPAGKKLGRIVHGASATTNLAFGGDDWKTLFFTTRGELGSVRVKIPGVSVPAPRR